MPPAPLDLEAMLAGLQEEIDELRRTVDTLTARLDAAP